MFNKKNLLYIFTIRWYTSSSYLLNSKYSLTGSSGIFNLLKYLSKVIIFFKYQKRFNHITFQFVKTVKNIFIIYKNKKILYGRDLIEGVRIIYI